MRRRLMIGRRWVLVAILGLAQLATLMGGVFWFGAWMRDSTHALLRDQILADNELVGAQMARLIEQMAIQDATPGSPDWERLQSAVESIKLPNQGFLCIVGSDTGQLLCHPELRRNPAMSEMTPGLATLHTARGPQSILSVNEAQGWAAMPDGVHLVAVRELPSLNARVMVHQHDEKVRVAVHELLLPAERIGWIIAATVALLGTWLAARIVVRYENHLANINEQLEEIVRQRTHSLMRTRNAVIFGLAKLAEYRDTDTGEHLDRIREYSTALAMTLQPSYSEIDDEFITNLALASSLHDIGKVAIPDAILLKPGRFTPQERAVMERHAQLGADCLAAIEDQLGSDDFLQMAREIALSHHEHVDGKGYPAGLRWEQIPLAARIVAVADVYDALRTRRVYKAAMSHQQAREIIEEGSGTQFHPLVVESFLKCEKQFQRICEEHQSATIDSDTSESVRLTFADLDALCVTSAN